MSQKVSWRAKCGHIQDLFYTPFYFLFKVYKSVANANSKQLVLSMDQDRIKINVLNKHFMIILKICN